MPKLKKHLHETTGKIDNNEPTNLDQLLGFNDLSKYGTLDEEEFKTRLLEMSKIDLQSFARDLGTVPIDNVERLQNNLLRDFRNYVFYLRKPAKGKLAPKEPSKEIKNILADGR